MKDLSKLGPKSAKYVFSLDADEHILAMSWVTLSGLPAPSLVVGTGVNVSEDLTSRGRILVFSTRDRDPGVLPAVYQRSQKWPVTVVGQCGEYLAVAEGFKLCFEQWEKSSFTKLAVFDGSIYITSMNSIKNFLMLGDVTKGLDFVQWKMDPQTDTKTLRRLSRSPPSSRMAVLVCDFVVFQKSLGMVALDKTGARGKSPSSP
eukprot:3172532-Amphidinium_carterae.1